MLGSAEAWVGVVEELAVAVEVGVAGRVGGCLGDGDRAGYFNLARSDPRARLGAWLAQIATGERGAFAWIRPDTWNGRLPSGCFARGLPRYLRSCVLIDRYGGWGWRYWRSSLGDGGALSIPAAVETI